MTQLAVSNLVKYYHKRAVVKDISYTVDSGEIVGLLGPNGAGKTTSFYMTVGLIPQDGGEIVLNAQDITNLTMDQRARLGLGYLPQESSIFRKLSVEDNIMAILELRPELDEQQRSTLLESLLQEFHIISIRHSLGLSLSGGERRRVEIARALAVEPKFILLDEPFAGIDPISVIDIKRIIKHLAKRNIGVLMTDHNFRETLDICHRAYIISQGEVIAEGASQDILTNPKVREVYLGQPTEE